MTSFRYNPALKHWFRENGGRFDAVVVHGIFKYHLIAAWQGLGRGGTPYFVILHGMLNPWFKSTYPLKHMKKAVMWHSLIHRAIGGAASLLYLCEEEQRLAEMSFRIKVGNTDVVPLGIEGPPAVDSDLILARHPELNGKRVLLFLGRICVMKACGILIRSFAKACVRDERLMLVMAGPDNEGLQSGLMRLAEELGIGNRVVWPGPLYQEMKWAAMRVAEVFVLPSHCETFPVAVLEALSCGVPVLISRKVNIYREVERHDAGVFFDDSEEGVDAGLAAWLEMTTSHREAMRENARSCFAAEFEVSAALRKHVDTYQRRSAGGARRSSGC
jgi:glycosyltransferase involved in cell wall biosynthesis